MATNRMKLGIFLEAMDAFNNLDTATQEAIRDINVGISKPENFEPDILEDVKEFIDTVAYDYGIDADDLANKLEA